ncbi:hypothetical protein [Cyclobacterium marinum]|uniref:hypothetical protein n=1 Tax=Cyclobacterium marinum TaxID=104 RepID=UPI0011EDF897|nr:hypothetical protein [Cyclobacterium marinum]MBI0397450.1 hypothetical protein [Cyclobacterium marinum]|tara:strand:- start:2066 stop:3022 length:957 start_codon:yes stop_codon:yes gene_type:complete
MNITLDIAALASAILYPLVILIVFILFRKEIPLLIKSLTGRLTGLSFAGISLDLAKAEEFSPNWLAQGALDLRQKAQAANVNDSTAGNFRSILETKDDVDYVIVNLGRGKEWLASRLYIMAIIFENRKGIKGIVFLESTKNTRKKYIGWAEPEKVRWALANQFPWFEKAYSEAYGIILDQGAKIINSEGRLGNSYDPNSSGYSITLLENFLKKIQSPPENPPLPEEEIEWVNLPSDPLNPTHTKEHTCWLNGQSLENTLAEVLITENIKPSSQSSEAIDKQVKMALISSQKFIAVVNEEKQFSFLVKREKILEQLLPD